jgi:predicted MFS family arabinose efflux permease
MVIVNTVVYVQGVLGGGDAAVTLAFAVSGGGSMLAALLLPKVLDHLTERSVMLAGGALMAAGMAAGMLLPGLPGLLAIWLVIGVGASLVQTPAGRLLRRSADAADRPALFAAQFALSHACWLLTYQCKLHPVPVTPASCT